MCWLRKRIAHSQTCEAVDYKRK